MSADHVSSEKDLFEDLGRKVESTGPNDNDKDATAVTGTGTDQEEPHVVDEIESMCMNCHENGTTRLLLTRIPYFREVILMSFFCPHCNFKNSEIQSAGQIQQKGCRYRFTLQDVAAFSRQLVKSDTCVAKFEELDIEIPPGRGQLTNVEGLLSMVANDLEFEQPARRGLDPDLHAKIEGLIAKARDVLKGNAFPLTLSLDDPAGNSWIEPSADQKAAAWSRSDYARTPEQNEALGLTDTGDKQEKEFESEIVPDEVYSFPATCPGCTRSCTTHMKMVKIPFFKEVVIMSTACDDCGYRSNDIKTGGEVPEKGTRTSLKVDSAEDLSRDILKSESAALSCPELKLSVNPGTMGGRFTTVEGLLTQVRDDLHRQIFDSDDVDAAGGDSLVSDEKRKWDEFFGELNKAIKAERSFTVTLTDPLACSYVQSLTAPDPDPKITIEQYDRTHEEEEDLGLLDMKTDGYSADVPDAEAETGTK
ncbi:MAG: hypothetical protein M1825_002454 [Sarcosagium campestre]|nr:MAG: hypothetical protein M1825_002454 [Sarcosagium campestre]